MRVVHISSLVRTLVYVKHQKTFRLNYAAYNVSVKCIIVVFSILKLGDLCLMSLLSTSQSLIKKQNFLYTLIKTSLSSTHTHRHTQTQTQAYALQIEKITFKVSSEIKVLSSYLGNKTMHLVVNPLTYHREILNTGPVFRMSPAQI